MEFAHAAVLIPCGAERQRLRDSGGTYEISGEVEPKLYNCERVAISHELPAPCPELVEAVNGLGGAVSVSTRPPPAPYVMSVLNFGRPSPKVARFMVTIQEPSIPLKAEEGAAASVGLKVIVLGDWA